MNGHRKLLIFAVNELLARKLISLAPSGSDLKNEEEHGHVLLDLCGYPAAINWNNIGFDELRVSVWWKYDHSRHPQADFTGNSRERFRTSRPLAKRQHYARFVGATVSGWLERKTGAFLEGRGSDKLYDVYTRQGEREALVGLPEPVPAGFGAEGRFFL
jgi:hypothetical protein